MACVVDRTVERMSPGSRIKYGREHGKNRMTQVRLAEVCRVSQGTVSRWENGLLVPTYAQAAILRKLFGGKIADYCRA